MVSPTALLSGHSDRSCERGGRFICDRREGGSVPCLSATFKEGAESGGLGTGEFWDMVCFYFLAVSDIFTCRKHRGEEQLEVSFCY